VTRRSSLGLVLTLLAAAAFPSVSHADESVAYQLDTAHSGGTQDATLRPPLKMAWAVPLGVASYPLIADGRVFVTSDRTLVALDLHTGRTLWAAALGGEGHWSGAAYDADRVFAINGDGLVRAFDAATGTGLWSYAGGPGESPPVAEEGALYFSESSSWVTALRQSDGSQLWKVRLGIVGSRSSPALDGRRAYVAHGCGTTFGLERESGGVDWRYPFCEGETGVTAALHRGRLYFGGPDDRETQTPGGVSLDAETGKLLSRFATGSIPALSDNVGVFANGRGGNRLDVKTLEARNLESGERLWTFEGDGQLTPSPIIVNGIVYVGSWTGRLFALALDDGRVLWQDDIAHEFRMPDEHNATGGLYGLGAGEGYFVAGVGGTNAYPFLVAYRAGAAPVVRTDRPTGVTPSRAQLNATVNPCGSPVRVTFHADIRALPSSTYRLEAVPASAELPADFEPHRVSAPLEHLESASGQGWHYRAVVEYGTRGAARFAGAEQFLPPTADGQTDPPEISLGAPSVGAEKVFIPARIDGRGAPFSAWVEYGESTDRMVWHEGGTDGSSDPQDPDQRTFELWHWTLKPNTLYPYRVVAVGPAGKVVSDDATFVTPGGSGRPQQSPPNPRPAEPEDASACAGAVDDEPDPEPNPGPGPTVPPVRPVPVAQPSGSLTLPSPERELQPAGAPPADLPRPAATASRPGPVRHCATVRTRRMSASRIRARGVSCRVARRIARAALRHRTTPPWRCLRARSGRARVCLGGTRRVEFRARHRRHA
jgi:outer membrane protein assembly factor BamB